MAKQRVGKIKCFSRVTISNPDGTLVGDSGMVGPNMITNLGIQQYLTAGIVGTLAGNSTLNVQYMALGSTDATANASNCIPASNATGFVCEIAGSTKRHSITSAVLSSRANVASSATQWIYGTFATTSSFLTGAGVVLGGVALFASSGGGGQIFCGNTFVGSACASNQAVNVTYQIQLG